MSNIPLASFITSSSQKRKDYKQEIKNNVEENISKDYFQPESVKLGNSRFRAMATHRNKGKPSKRVSGARLNNTVVDTDLITKNLEYAIYLSRNQDVEFLECMLSDYYSGFSSYKTHFEDSFSEVRDALSKGIPVLVNFEELKYIDSAFLILFFEWVKKYIKKNKPVTSQFVFWIDIGNPSNRSLFFKVTRLYSRIFSE